MRTALVRVHGVRTVVSQGQAALRLCGLDTYTAQYRGPGRCASAQRAASTQLEVHARDERRPAIHARRPAGRQCLLHRSLHAHGQLCPLGRQLRFEKLSPRWLPSPKIFGARDWACRVAPSPSKSAEGERPKGQRARARRRPQRCLRPRRRRRWRLLRQSPHRLQARSPQTPRLQLRVPSDGSQTGGGEHSSGSRRSGPSARARRRRPQLLGAQQAAVAQLAVAEQLAVAQRAQAATQVAARLAVQQQAAMTRLL